MKISIKKEERAMSNKFPKLAVLSLLGILALSSCSSSSSEIKAYPSNNKDEVVTIDGVSEEIHNNILSIINENIHDDSLASETLNKVLYLYAQSIFGSYNKNTLVEGDTSTTLKEAAKDYASNSADKTILDNFIRAHKAYWTYNEKNEHVDDEGNVVKDDKNFNPSASERTRVFSRWQNIEKRIAENMFNRINGGSYKVANKFFSEKEYLRSLHEAGEDVTNYLDINWNNYHPLVIDYTVEGEDVFENDILTRRYYQTGFGLSEDETVIGPRFIEKKVVTEVYNDLLVEQYLLDEEVSAVRNSRARQINVIKIEKYDNFTINADLLVKRLVKDIYANIPTGETLSFVDEDHNEYIDTLFERYAMISKGLYEEIQSDDDAKAIITELNNSRSDAYEVKTGEKSGFKYYANTTYGDLVEDYEELLSAESYDEIDTDLYSKFTANYTCEFDQGFDQEVISIDQTKSITKGWYVQKSAPSLDSNSEITKNLFQISVANNKIEIKDENDLSSLEELAAVDRIYMHEGSWKVRETPSDKENKYLCSINGNFFLKFEGQYSGDSYLSDIVYDDGSAYYIVQVLEAVKDVKLRNKLSTNSYANTRGEEFLNKVLSEVTRKVAETGNYSSLAKEHWLEDMNITYHDQSVYNYFKDNYPDLFN